VDSDKRLTNNKNKIKYKTKGDKLYLQAARPVSSSYHLYTSNSRETDIRITATAHYILIPI